MEKDNIGFPVKTCNNKKKTNKIDIGTVRRGENEPTKALLLSCCAFPIRFYFFDFASTTLTPPTERHLYIRDI